MQAKGELVAGNRNNRRVTIYLESTLVGILSGLIIVLYRLAIVSLQDIRTILLPAITGSWVTIALWLLIAVIASFVAIAMKSRPIYDSLLARMVPGCQDDERSRPVTLHIPLSEGSVLESMERVRTLLPEGCILTAVERGEEELYPRQDLALHPGDVLHVVVELGKAHRLMEQLLTLGQPSADSVDGD